ncbi:hypothetical protein TSUD_295240 [Trifolium subterraneum]|uniref:Uncharacterized protein n=1 Tax=Trifolium subterraneum TaxID=3900 RepID=A0A2Z6MSZ4_TRISU|nr:hypothetical protein TSUD_295240 [Trifolium subterraneum]
MKTSILAFSIISLAFICKTIEAAEPVLDISGNKVTTGVKYYILPVIRGKGGGLTVTNVNNLNSNNSTCPLYVLQEKLEVKNGQAVTFTPYNAKQGGVEGNPGFDTIFNWFKIEKADKDYVLSSCPSVSTTKTLCRELGLYVYGNGNKHLALSDQVPSFRVVFKRA